MKKEEKETEKVNLHPITRHMWLGLFRKTSAKFVSVSLRQTSDRRTHS